MEEREDMIMTKSSTGTMLLLLMKRRRLWRRMRNTTTTTPKGAVETTMKSKLNVIMKMLDTCSVPS